MTQKTPDRSVEEITNDLLQRLDATVVTEIVGELACSYLNHKVAGNILADTLQAERQRREEIVEKERAKAFLQFSLMLPSVSDGDKTDYARGVRDTVNNLRIDLKALTQPNNLK